MYLTHIIEVDVCNFSVTSRTTELCAGTIYQRVGHAYGYAITPFLVPIKFLVILVCTDSMKDRTNQFVRFELRELV